jgi:hypothetical protein
VVAPHRTIIGRIETDVVILRPTRKLREALPASEVTSAQSDTALGDWYVNRIVVDRRPLLLLVSSTSLLPMVVPARDVRGLPGRLADVVETRLRRLGIASRAIEAETRAMHPVVVAPTEDRSVVGIAVDFAKSLPYYLGSEPWDDSTLQRVEDKLAETPCHASRAFERVVFPERKAPELLRVKWAG